MEERALVPSGIVAPLVSVDEAVEAWRQYLRLCEKLLDDSDYQTIEGRLFRKKSGWRKLARAFNITDEIDDKEIIRDDRARVISAEFTVLAVAPNGRTAIGWGSCSLEERAHAEDKLDRNGNVRCPGPCDGRKHFSNPDHDIPATAHTRAKNRGIADLIGAGEVSAEEIEADELEREAAPTKQAPPQKKARPVPTPTVNEPVTNDTKRQISKADIEWFGNEMESHAMSSGEVAQALGMRLGGWLKANQKQTVQDAWRLVEAWIDKRASRTPRADEPLPGEEREDAEGASHISDMPF